MRKIVLSSSSSSKSSSSSSSSSILYVFVVSLAFGNESNENQVIKVFGFEMEN